MIMLRLIPLEVGENWILYTSRANIDSEYSLQVPYPPKISGP